MTEAQQKRKRDCARTKIYDPGTDGNSARQLFVDRCHIVKVLALPPIEGATPTTYTHPTYRRLIP